METATVTPKAADSIDVGNAQRGARNTVTASGETRSELYRRLRSEGAWDVAEEFKEIERARCRSAGSTKAEAGVQAWDAVAKAFPVADAATCFEFISRSHRPPLVSTVADITDETELLARAWSVTLTIAGRLATRCPEIRENCGPLIQAIDVRQNMEPADSMLINAEAIERIEDYMIANSTDMVRFSQGLFSNYQTSANPYSDAVADELEKLSKLMRLLPNLIDLQWSRITSWLHGPRRIEAGRFLARACENQAELSSRIA
jgi:hypothetical protein